MTGENDFPEALLSELQRQVWQLREQEKLEMAEIAQRLGIVIYRVQHLWSQADERVRDYQLNGKKAWSLVNGRVRRSLAAQQLMDWDELKEAITSGKLKWRGTYLGGAVMNGAKHVKSIGWEHWVALHDWVGLPHPEPVEPLMRGRRKKAQMKLESLPLQKETDDLAAGHGDGE